MKKLSKILSLALSLVLVLSLTAVFTFAADDVSVPSGTEAGKQADFNEVLAFPDMTLSSTTTAPTVVAPSYIGDFYTISANRYGRITTKMTADGNRYAVYNFNQDLSASTSLTDGNQIRLGNNTGSAGFKMTSDYKYYVMEIDLMTENAFIKNTRFDMSVKNSSNALVTENVVYNFSVYGGVLYLTVPNWSTANSKVDNQTVALNTNGAWNRLTVIYDHTTNNLYSFVNGELKGLLGSTSNSADVAFANNSNITVGDWRICPYISGGQYTPDHSMGIDNFSSKVYTAEEGKVIDDFIASVDAGTVTSLDSCALSTWSTVGKNMQNALTDKVVASIGENNYATFEAAMLAAKAGDTIELWDHVYDAVITKAVTIQTNCHWFTYADSELYITDGIQNANTVNESYVFAKNPDADTAVYTFTLADGSVVQLEGIAGNAVEGAPAAGVIESEGTVYRSKWVDANGNDLPATFGSEDAAFVLVADTNLPIIYSVETNGNTYYYAAADAFASNVAAITGTANVKLYQDITSGLITVKSTGGLYIDLNGKTLTGTQSNSAFFQPGVAGAKLHVYSSVVGARLVAKASDTKHPCFALITQNNADFSLGTYGDYPGSNITFESGYIADIRANSNITFNLDGVTFKAIATLAGTSLFYIREASNLTINIKNANIVLNGGKGFVRSVAATTANSPKTITVDNCNIVQGGSKADFFAQDFDTDISATFTNNKFYGAYAYTFTATAQVSSTDATGEVVLGSGNYFQHAPNVAGTKLNFSLGEGVVLARDNDTFMPALNYNDGNPIFARKLAVWQCVEEKYTYNVYFHDGIDTYGPYVIVQNGNIQAQYSGTLAASANGGTITYDFGDFVAQVKAHNSNTKPLTNYQRAPKNTSGAQQDLNVYLQWEVTEVKGMQYNLTLYNDLTLNVYVPAKFTVADSLGVRYAVIGEENYNAVVFKRISTEIDTNVSISVGVDIGGKVFNYTAVTSVTQYLNQLISSTDNQEYIDAQPLAKAIAVYAYEVLANTNINTESVEASELLTTLYNDNKTSVNGGDYTVANAKAASSSNVISDNLVSGLNVSIELGVAPTWYFTDADGNAINEGTVTYTAFDGSEVVASIVNGYIDTDMKLCDFGATLTFSVGGVYNYATYLASADLADYDAVAGSLYFLAEAANAYKVANPSVQ